MVNVLPKTTERHYSTEEAGKLLNVTADTVKRYCNASPPRIHGKKPFGRRGPWVIPQSSIDKYISEESESGRPKESHRNGNENGKQK